MQSLFRSELLAREFEENGFVVLPFLTEKEVNEIKQLFNKYKPREGNYHIYSNLEDNSPAVNLTIENKISEIFQRSIDSTFCNYKIYGGSYLVKGTGIDSATTLHQDWNIVDESTDTSLTIWVPIQDVDETNGCLQVIPGSHRWFSSIRSSNISSLYIKFESNIQKALVSLPVKAGTAVVFAFNLFHGSKPNQTQNLRKAVHLALVNQQAETIHYIRDTANKKILKVRCDKNFLYKEMFDIVKGKIPAQLDIIDSFPDDGTFTINEKHFWERINSSNTLV